MLSRLPPATRYLLIANIVLSVIGMLLPGSWVAPFALWPLLPGWVPEFGPAFMPWQLATHAFLHAGPVHLMLNMLGLVMFGVVLEHEWGQRRFLIFYTTCILGAAACQFGLATWMAFRGEHIQYSVGASGGVVGLLTAFGLLFPNERLRMFFVPYRFKARDFVLLMIGLQVLLLFFGGDTGESHIAHLGGAFFGWTLIRYWARGRKSPPKGPKSGRRPNHLRAVP